MFNHKLLYEMKEAAFVRGYHLQTYFSDVDHDGFDVIFDDGDNLRKVQLKTVGANADTTSWDIHKGILRPLPNNYEEMGFNFEGFWGVEGGVVLIEYFIDAKNAICTSYLFTDIYVINAIAVELIARHGNTKKAAIALRANDAAGRAKDQISVAKGLFVRVASSQNLLCLIGMHSALPRPAWQQRIKSLSSEAWQGNRTLSGLVSGLRSDPISLSPR